MDTRCEFLEVRMSKIYIGQYVSKRKGTFVITT